MKWVRPVVLAMVLAARAATAQGVTVRAVISAAPAERRINLDPLNVTTSTGTLVSGEGELRSAWLGAHLRVLSGNLNVSGVDAGQIAIGELAAEAGPRVAAARVGYDRRAVTGALGTVTSTAVTLGGSSVVEVGGTGLTARADAALFASGGTGERLAVSLDYARPGVPFVLTAGYRAEVFSTTSGAVTRSERVAALLFGVGVIFGR